jgi:hypothetical protein
LKTSIHRREVALLRSTEVVSLARVGWSVCGSGAGSLVTLVAPFLCGLMLPGGVLALVFSGPTAAPGQGGVRSQDPGQLGAWFRAAILTGAR